MTTATLLTHGRKADTEMARPRRSLEELVNRLIETLFPTQTETAEPSVTRSIHEARRLRQAGDIDCSLGVLAGMDTVRAEAHQARWAFAEWKQMVERRFGDSSPMVYSQVMGRVATLVLHPHDGRVLGAPGKLR